MSAVKGRPFGPHFKRRHNTGWQERAACIDANPRIFFDASRYTEALTICADCPVKDPCRELGKGTEGVWGGRVHMPRKKARP